VTGGIAKLNNSCISKPEIRKSQIGPVQFRNLEFQDLQCRNRSISEEGLTHSPAA
jgi:hypothetical protein